MIIDHFYYQIENHGTGNTYIFIVDYKNLKEYSPKDVPATGVMYADPLNPKRNDYTYFFGCHQNEGTRCRKGDTLQG